MALDIKFDISGQLNPNGLYTIYDLEIHVLQSLNQFNAVYAQYLRCKDDIPLRDPTINAIMRSNTNKNCYSSPEREDVTNAHARLKQNIEYYKKAYDQIPSESTDANAPIDMANLNKKYKEVLEMRNDLDVKTAEIEKGEESQYAKYKERYDSTMYIQIIMTILLISILYYVFLHM